MLKPEAQQRCVEDSAEASLRAQQSENAGLCRKMPFPDEHYIIMEPTETETMATCVNHPDKPTGLVCMKYQIHVCEQCANCRDPQLYCKHRTACPIWFIAKDGENGWGD
jgi:hypothetical protein